MFVVAVYRNKRKFRMADTCLSRASNLSQALERRNRLEGIDVTNSIEFSHDLHRKSTNYPLANRTSYNQCSCSSRNTIVYRYVREAMHYTYIFTKFGFLLI